VAGLLATVRTRVGRLLRRRGLAGDDDVAPLDPLAEESAALAGISTASVQGRIALGRRAAGEAGGLDPTPAGQLDLLPLAACHSGSAMKAAESV